MARRDAAPVLSTNEKTFIVSALKQGQRIDGRAPLDVRAVRFEFAPDGSACTVRLGATRVMTTVTATLEPPYPDRPNEGSLRFNVEFLPMAAPYFESGRSGEAATEVARLVERGLRESGAIDKEALVVLAGRKDHQGNLTDACGLSALGALMAFRRPDVTVGGGEDGQAVTVHSPDVREPLPLSIHHLPLPISFALFEDSQLLAVDPCLKEELAASGTFTVTQVAEFVAQLKQALEAHQIAKVAARVRRHRAGDGEHVDVEELLARAARGGAAPAAAPGTGAAGTALDLGALPEGVRNLLLQAEEALGDADASSSGSEESDEEESEEEGESSSEAEEEGEGEDAGGHDEAADGAAQRRAGGGGGGGPPEAMEEDGAAPAAGSAKRPAAPAAGGGQPRPQGKKRRPSGTGVQPGDEFEAIASLIAGAGAARQQQGGSGGGLAAAVKPGAGKQKNAAAKR
eukprot:scaffold9.g3075.t1